MSQSPDQFLMGGGITSAKFDRIGDTVTGTVHDTPEVRQQTDIQTGELQVWPDGRPKMQLVVTLQTSLREEPDDDGLRRIYVKGKSLTDSVRDAVRKSGAKGLEVGGQLTVKYVGDGEQTKRGFNPPKLYAAQYERATAGAANSFLNGGGQPAQSQPPF